MIAASKRASIKAAVEAVAACSTASALKESFNDLIACVAMFRRVHLSIVMDYVVKQQPQRAAAAGSGPTSVTRMEDTAGGKGTGGTDIVDFLGSH